MGVNCAPSSVHRNIARHYFRLKRCHIDGEGESALRFVRVVVCSEFRQGYKIK